MYHMTQAVLFGNSGEVRLKGAGYCLSAQRIRERVPNGLLTQLTFLVCTENEFPLPPDQGPESQI